MRALAKMSTSWDFRTAVFAALCATSLACGVATTFAVVAPAFIRQRADDALRVSLVASMMAFCYRILYTLTPALKRRDAAALRAEASKCVGSNGFQYIVYGSIVLAMPRGTSNAPALAPFCILSAYQLATTAAKLYGDDDGKGYWRKIGMEKVFQEMQANMELALAICATIEISLLTPMLLDLFSSRRRSVTRVLAYVSWLRSRYHCKDNTVYRIKYTRFDTAHYHRDVWSMLDEKLVSKVPALRRLLAPISTWFCSAR